MAASKGLVAEEEEVVEVEEVAEEVVAEVEVVAGETTAAATMVTRAIVTLVVRAMEHHPAAMVDRRTRPLSTRMV